MTTCEVLTHQRNSFKPRATNTDTGLHCAALHCKVREYTFEIVRNSFLVRSVLHHLCSLCLICSSRLVLSLGALPCYVHSGQSQ